MNKRFVSFLVVMSIALIVFSFTASAFGQTNPLVIVAGIDITAPGVHGESTLPDALTDLMINALLNSNRFRVLERRKLETILTEQGFQHASGLVDQATAVELGKMLGASLVITGSVTDVAATGTGSVRIGPIKVGTSTLRVTLAIRIVDVQTGEILYSIVEQKRESASNVGLNLPVVGGLSGFSQTSLSIISAVNELCITIVDGFIAQMDQRLIIRESLPLEGYVVAVRGQSIYLNLNQASGIKVGQIVRVFREGDSIRDPKTGLVLDRELILLADCQVTMVRENLSEAEVVRTHERQIPINEEDIVLVLPGGTSTLDYLLAELPAPREIISETPTSVIVGNGPERILEEEFLVATNPDTVEIEDISLETTITPEVTVEEANSSMEAESVPGEFLGQEVEVYVEYHPNGNPRIEYTFYRLGGQEILHGWYRSWHENGVTLIEGTYRKGLRDGLWREYMRTGSLKAEGNFAGGTREGHWTVYYESGHKELEGSYLNGLKQGTWKNYINSAAGLVFSQVDYNRDQEVPGTYIEYDQHGNVVRTR